METTSDKMPEISLIDHEKASEIDRKPMVFDGSVNGRGKTALRLKYEAEVLLIRRKLGDLEQIRERLGLPQRKICQLLLVDPSAWSRWVRNGEGAPPHIYRMLQWYLALEEKYPALDVGFWLANHSYENRGVESAATAQELSHLKTELESSRRDLLRLSEQLRHLRAEYTHQKKRLLGLAWVACSMLCLALALALAFAFSAMK